MSDAPSSRPRPLRFAAFAMSAAGPAARGTRPPALAGRSDFDDLEHWVRLARTLERGRFDLIVFADAVAHHPAGFLTPAQDPSVLAGAIAYVTDHLGIAFTASAKDEHPFNFARRISALDHASRGRIAWNILADDSPSARAQEYLDVAYKLWEGSWEEDALGHGGPVHRQEADGKVHPINHQGPHYQVQGPHLVSPTPQRTPVLIQAGADASGRDWAAENAEAVFIRSATPADAARESAAIRARAAGHGRWPEDLLFFAGLHVVTGATEAEAKRKAADHDERTADAARVSLHTGGSRIAGAPEQVADELARWRQAGVDGVSLVNVGGPEAYEEFVDHVAPILQSRGLMQRDYPDGTFRRNLLGRGDRLPERHPAARYRDAFAPQPADRGSS
jgi:long-chain alkane monooxygenase